MGIPKLKALLAPYASFVPLSHPKCATHGTDGEFSMNKRTVIDGPGLAHLIFKNLASQRPKAKTTVELGLPYASIEDATLDWLNTLESFGLHM
jgi:hypothetical protein